MALAAEISFVPVPTGLFVVALIAVFCALGTCKERSDK